MGCIQNYGCCQRNRHLIIPLILLLIPILTNTGFMAEGRAISKLVHSASLLDYSPKMRVMVGRRRLIGSRPPRCERRCSSCGHCEAIQVPVAPKLKISNAKRGINTHHYGGLFATATPNTASSRGDDISNYKPICWKCKCGDFIFNP